MQCIHRYSHRDEYDDDDDDDDHNDVRLHLAAHPAQYVMIH